MAWMRWIAKGSEKFYFPVSACNSSQPRKDLRQLLKSSTRNPNCKVTFSVPSLTALDKCP